MRRILLAAAALLGAALPASAATVRYRTDAELIALSARVVRGRVVDSVVERAPSGAVRTRSRIAVIEDFTGGADAVLTVLERGGRFGDGSGVWIPGAPRFVPGDDVVLCLEPTAGGYRTVAMAFSAFRVGAVSAGDRPLTRFGGTTVVGRGSLAGVEASRGLADFRRTAAAVTGVAARAVATDAQAAAAVAAAPAARVGEPFTLLGEGIRWQQADNGQPVAWYRNTLRPSPVQGADTDAQIGAALTGWTDPPTASIVLTFGGTRNVAIEETPGEDPYCSAGNLGVGLITFGDPLDDLQSGVLAIGGGCAGPSTHVVNGQIFNPFTHGLVVLNDDASIEGFRTVPNITRILEHEIGHAIGLGHTDQGTDNIMYPSCCLPEMPVPPAIGPDDLAGLVFIYPLIEQPCAYTLSPPSTTVGPIGGEIAIAVTTSRADCAWVAAPSVSWIIPTEGARGVGPGTVRLSIAPAIGSPAQRSGTVAIATATATVVQAADTDEDTDGLPDAWEVFFGLNPASGGGDDGPAGDPDTDGVSNADERVNGTHPRGFYRRYLAEGAANAFFDTEVALFNPAGNAASVLLRIQPESGPEVGWPVRVPVLKRRTVLSTLFEALAPGSFAVVIEGDRPIVVDRTMRWDASGYGAHTESAIESPATTWYLAEGSTAGDFALFYLLQNPGSTATQAAVRFLRPSPLPPLDRTYTLAPRARLTIPVDAVAPELASADVSAIVTAAQPIIVERAMYLSRPGQPFAAGHESAGITAPGLDWFLAEGATGSFFDLFVLIENPSTQDATVEVQYLQPSGRPPLTKQYLVRAESRFTIYVDDEQIPAGSGQRPLAATSVSMRVRATNGVPIVVERAMWWPQPAWYEAHNAPATSVIGAQWITAGGQAGGATNAETFMLIANTGPAAVDAAVFVHFEDDSAPLTTSVSLPPQSRTSVPIGATFPAIAGRRFAVQVTGAGAAALVVERATYESPGGVTWAAGSAAVATRVTP